MSFTTSFSSASIGAPCKIQKLSARNRGAAAVLGLRGEGLEGGHHLPERSLGGGVGRDAVLDPLENAEEMAEVRPRRGRWSAVAGGLSLRQRAPDIERAAIANG